jgi:hypothetical protein
MEVGKIGTGTEWVAGVLESSEKDLRLDKPKAEMLEEKAKHYLGRGLL